MNKKHEADRFNVNEKTIQRDLEDLRTYFAEYKHDPLLESIVYKRKNNGYLLTNHDEIWLTNREVLVLAKILLESRAFQKSELKSILNKLILQCPIESRKYIEGLLLNELFHYVPLKHQQPLFQRLWDLSVAVKEKKCIELHYLKEKQSEPVFRMIEPLGIMFSEFYFYLIGYLTDFGYDTPIVYRIDRILEYKVTEKRFFIPESLRFEEGEFRKRVQFMNPGKLLKIKLSFSGPSLEAVLDRLPISHVCKQEGSTSIIEAEVYGTGIKMWLLSQAHHIEVLEPLEFRKEMTDTIKKMMENYTSK